MTTKNLLNDLYAAMAQKRNDIKDLYLRGRYSAKEVKQQLADLGYPPSHQNMYLDQWEQESKS